MSLSKKKVAKDRGLLRGHSNVIQIIEKGEKWLS